MIQGVRTECYWEGKPWGALSHWESLTLCHLLFPSYYDSLVRLYSPPQTEEEHAYFTWKLFTNTATENNTNNIGDFFWHSDYCSVSCQRHSLLTCMSAILLCACRPLITTATKRSPVWPFRPLFISANVLDSTERNSSSAKANWDDYSRSQSHKCLVASREKWDSRREIRMQQITLVEQNITWNNDCCRLAQAMLLDRIDRSRRVSAMATPYRTQTVPQGVHRGDKTEAQGRMSLNRYTPPRTALTRRAPGSLGRTCREQAIRNTANAIS